MKFEVFAWIFPLPSGCMDCVPPLSVKFSNMPPIRRWCRCPRETPRPEAFPVEAVRALSADILQQQPIAALQYSVTEGYPPLRAHLTAYMQQKHGIGRAGDDILITSGAQQAMEMVAKVLCNEGMW